MFLVELDAVPCRTLCDMLAPRAAIDQLSKRASQISHFRFFFVSGSPSAARTRVDAHGADHFRKAKSEKTKIREDVLVAK